MNFLEGTTFLWVLLSAIAASATITIVYLNLIISRRKDGAGSITRSIVIESPRSTTYGGNPGTIRKISSDPPPFPDIIQSAKRRLW